MDVQITYETLFDLLRKERSLNELQLLDSLFWKDVVLYLQDRQASASTKSSLEQEKLQIQLRNIKRILKEIFERREQKLFDLAINVMKTETDTLIDKTTMLPEEEALFNDTLILLKKYKANVLLQVFSGSLPSMTTSDHSYFENSYTKQVSDNTPLPSTDSLINDKSDNTSSKSFSDNPSDSNSLVNNQEKDSDSVSNSTLDKSNKSSNSQTDSHPFNPLSSDTSSSTTSSFSDESSDSDILPQLEENEETLIVKFTSSVPKFLGKNKEVFGPYSVGKIVQLPSHIASILLKKGKVKPVLA